jgi:hypothetical protein
MRCTVWLLLFAIPAVGCGQPGALGSADGTGVGFAGDGSTVNQHDPSPDSACCDDADSSASADASGVDAGGSGAGGAAGTGGHPGDAGDSDAGDDADSSAAETGGLPGDAGDDADSSAAETGGLPSDAGDDADSSAAETGGLPGDAGDDADSSAAETGGLPSDAGDDADSSAAETGGIPGDTEDDADRSAAETGGLPGDAGDDADSSAAETGGLPSDAGDDADSSAAETGGLPSDAGDDADSSAAETGGLPSDAGDDADSSADGTMDGPDATDDAESGGTDGTTEAGGPGHVAYRLAGGPVFLIEATAGAQPLNVTQALDALSPGTDGGVNLSPDGEWLSVVTTRFGCQSVACMVVIDVGLNQPDVLQTAGGQRVIGEAAAAVGSGGDVVVFSAAGSAHERDLFVTRRTGAFWSEPVDITGASTFSYNTAPAIAEDGGAVLFDCGPLPYGVNGTHVCEVGIDGSALRVVVDPTNSPNGESGNRAHSADYAPDGSIVFEAEWGSERIWRLAPGASVPTVIGAFGNDNTPCVLPDGRVASLWLNAESNPSGFHELKLMAADGADPVMLVQGVDVLDTTVGCGW